MMRILIVAVGTRGDVAPYTGLGACTSESGPAGTSPATPSACT
jgi:UDP:flavonoid glycosyltransferase YjiC (YdhE family)